MGVLRLAWRLAVAGVVAVCALGVWCSGAWASSAPFFGAPGMDVVMVRPGVGA
jgi:hypothetical protein